MGTLLLNRETAIRVRASGLYRRQCIVFSTVERVEDHRTGGEFEMLVMGRSDHLVKLRITSQTAFVLGCNVARFILKFYYEKVRTCTIVLGKSTNPSSLP